MARRQIFCNLPDGGNVVVPLDDRDNPDATLPSLLGSMREIVENYRQSRSRQQSQQNEMSPDHHHCELRPVLVPSTIAAATTNSSASGGHPEASSDSSSVTAASQHQRRSQEPPLQVSDVQGGELCPPLHQLFAVHRPQSQFDRLLLAIHCLMVESGFVAVHSREDSATTAAAADYSLPESAARQLGGGASIFIIYAYRRAAGAAHALLKVVNTGRLAACHCGVAASLAEPPAVCASAHYNIDRFVGHDRAGNVSFSGFRHLSVHFKDTISGRAKAAIHEACGLPPLGLAGLPMEVLMKVMQRCDFVSVCRLGQANGRLNRLFSDNSVWREQLRRQASNSGYYRQVRTAELQGEQVNYYETFRAIHEERTQRMRMIARLSSRELSLSLLDVLPPSGFLPSLGQPRGRRGGRFSLDVFPEQPDAPYLGGGLFRDIYDPPDQPPF